MIAALIGLVSGGGGIRLAGFLVGPERDAKIVEYYRGVIRDLRHENEDLRKRVESLEWLTAKIANGELPPEYS